MKQLIVLIALACIIGSAFALPIYSSPLLSGPVSSGPVIVKERPLLHRVIPPVLSSSSNQVIDAVGSGSHRVGLTYTDILTVVSSSMLYDPNTNTRKEFHWDPLVRERIITSWKANDDEWKVTRRDGGNVYYNPSNGMTPKPIATKRGLIYPEWFNK